MKNCISLCQNYVKTNWQKVDQHIGGKWLIHGTEHRKDSQLQSLKEPDGNMFNPIF